MKGVAQRSQEFLNPTYEVNNLPFFEFGSAWLSPITASELLDPDVCDLRNFLPFFMRYLHKQGKPSHVKANPTEDCCSTEGNILPIVLYTVFSYFLLSL